MRQRSMLLALLLVIASLVNATQRLMIPKITNAAVDATGNIVFNSAFCIDPLRKWPTNAVMKYVYYGQEETWITLLVNGVQQTLTLKQAMSKGYVEMIAKGNGITMYPASKNIKLVKAKTNGFATGEANEPFGFDKSLWDVIPANPSPDDYFDNWGKVWEKVYAEYRLKKVDLVPEIINNRIKPLVERNNKAGVWEIGTKDNKIYIKEKKISGEKTQTNAFEELWNALDYISDGNASLCITIDPVNGTLTASINFSFEGTPLSVEFSSDNGFTVTTELTKTSVNDPGDAPLDISIEYSAQLSPRNEKDEPCKVELTTSLCIPPKESNITMTVCGKSITVKQGEINLGF